ncbi:MAG: helix-turn-helix domain-containing protein [Clostridiales bacterium]|jgi:transcriptional regulator with XRE-family HTH domain|nr:helix-turn-helix domain-containing protein [Clostridiales bacterium]
MNNTFDEFLDEELKDPKFRAAYDLLQPEGAFAQALIDAREGYRITQRQLSEKIGISQADISRIEIGDANPTIKTLQRLAAGMNMKLKIEFEPINIDGADLMLTSLNTDAPHPLSRAI